MQQRRNDGQLLLHAVGVCPDGLRQILRQAKGIAILPDALRPLCGAYAKDVCDKIKVLDACHVLVKLRVVRQIGQAALAFQRVVPHGNAIHINFAGIKLLDAAAAFQGSGLARAVVPDKGTQLPRADVQAKVLHGGLAAVGFGQMLYF